MIAAALWLLDAFNALVLVYFMSLNGVYLVTSLFAFTALRRYALRLKSFDTDDLIGSGAALPITLIAPAYNEAATCVDATRSLLGLHYPDFEIIVVNDGSRDETLTRLKEAFDLVPATRMRTTTNLSSAPIRAVYRSLLHRNLTVIDKENGGKADTLNAGLSYCSTPLFCAIDADSLLESDALIRVVRPFLEDGHTIAVGGIIRIVNGCEVTSGVVTKVRLPENRLARFQVLEYLRAFLSSRMGWAALDSTLIISGAFGLFRRSVVVDAGGYSTKTVGEDMELVVRLHRHCREKRMPYRIHFVPDPVAWTECPENLRMLGRQRDRWQRGLSEALIKHRRMLFNPRYGRIGMIAYPFFFFLEMFGPIVEIAGYITFALALALQRANGPYVLAFFMVAFVLGMALSLAAVALEELSFHRYPGVQALLALFRLSILETFGYRQLSTFWRVRGIVSALRGRKQWGEMPRRGFEVAPPAAK